jgi:TetR/AcrR family transcriptional repressor of nem operon
VGRTSEAKERLIQGAMALIHARSYANVGVQELCEHAGVKKGSFYHFFNTKQDLVLAALDQWWAVAKERNWNDAFSPSRPPMERIDRFFEINYELNHAEYEQSGQFSGCPFGNLSIEMCSQDEAIRAKIHAIFEDVVGRIKNTLDDAVADKILAPMDTQETALALWAYCEGVQLLAKAQQDLDLLHRLGHRATRFLQASWRKAV